MGVLTLYGAGFLVLSNTKKVPTSNKAGKFAMGLFGVGENDIIELYILRCSKNTK